MVKKQSTARRRASTKTTEPSTGSSVLVIDEHKLEQEWGNQAPLFYEYASQLADARLANDEAKAELDVTAAELDMAIRSNPDHFGVEKISEAAVKNAVVQQAAYQTAQEALNATTHAVRMLEAMTRALEHRKTALKSMVELRLANYYAEPTLPKTERDAYDEMSKQEVRSRGRRKPARDEDDSDDE